MVYKLDKDMYKFAASKFREIKTEDERPVTNIDWKHMFVDEPYFYYRGPLVAKERPRKAKSGGIYTPQATRDFERDVKIAATSYVAANDLKPHPYPIRVDLWLYDLPKEDGDVLLSIAGFKFEQKNDVDNIVKSIFDACNKILWHDDKQVVELKVTRRYSIKPGFTMKIYRAGLTDNEIATMLKVYEGTYGKDAN